MHINIYVYTRSWKPPETAEEKAMKAAAKAAKSAKTKSEKSDKKKKKTKEDDCPVKSEEESEEADEPQTLSIYKKIKHSCMCEEHLFSDLALVRKKKLKKNK